MSAAAQSWSTHQLTEYFAALSTCENESGVLRMGLERAAEAVDATLSAAVVNDRVAAVIGLGRGCPPPEWCTLQPGTGVLQVAGVGELNVCVTRLATARSRNAVPGLLIVGRPDDDFEPDEELLLHAMGSVLGMVIQSHRTLAAERVRHALLGQLFQVQRAIASGCPIRDILAQIPDAASRLRDGARVTLVLSDTDDKSGPAQLYLAASSHAPEADLAPVLEIARRAMDSGDLVQSESTPVREAFPVLVSGQTTGALVAESPTVPDPHSSDVLVAFGQQIGAALTDAQVADRLQSAFKDPVTGLPNRALFVQRLTSAIARHSQENAPLCVLFLDLDRFKAVNDSLGHAAGDQLLAVVSDRLRDNLRENDTAARLGGDEFAILLQDTEAETGLQIAARLVRHVCEPVVVTGHEVAVGASVGIAQTSRSIEADTLLGHADLAMYQAKREGSNAVRVFQPEMRDAAKTLLTLTNSLRMRQLDQFHVAYQPITDIHTLQPASMESLMRWTHPKLGPISPVDFIPLAEETGSIADLGLWILEQSISDLSEWRKLFPELQISVNLSPRQLLKPGFLCDVAAILRHAPVPPDSVIFEITEGVLLENTDQSLRLLHELRGFGAQLALDDFGTGYSSLSYLKTLPVDEVKLDRSFMPTAQSCWKSSVVIRSSISLCRDLGLTTVAEGIEDTQQLDLLREYGCNLAQGYLLSRPLPAKDATEVLGRLYRNASEALLVS